MEIITSQQRHSLADAVQRFNRAGKVVALTGAGVSVESGIDDFRSPGGLWTKYPPEEYGTLAVFHNNPQKAWKLFRKIGKGLQNKKPNRAHEVLAHLEESGKLDGIVTQNIDNLHQLAGSRNVLEIHGDHQHLHCLQCGELSMIDESIVDSYTLPCCQYCGNILKPNVVLFGENVRYLEEIHSLIHRCDVLLVIGTSAQVHPAASLPLQVKASGGLIYEFNIEETILTQGGVGADTRSDFFFKGKAGTMLNIFLEELLLKKPHDLGQLFSDPH